MKKKGFIFIGIILFLLILIVLFYGVSISSSVKENNSQIVCTTYPLYLLTKHLVDHSSFQVEYINSANGGCAHDYRVTPRDRLLLEKAEGIIFIGKGMDNHFLDGVAKLEDKFLVDSSKSISNLIYFDHNHHEEEHSHSGDDINKKEHHHNECVEHINGHFFVSPKLYLEMGKEITLQLSSYKEDEAKIFQKNLTILNQSLFPLIDKIDSYKNAKKNYSIVTQHSAFDYLALDLGLEVAAVISVHGGEGVSSAKILKLIQLIKDEDVKLIIGEPAFSDKIIKVLSKESNIPFEVLDPISTGPVNATIDFYVSKMEENIEKISKYY